MRVRLKPPIFEHLTLLIALAVFALFLLMFSSRKEELKTHRFRTAVKIYILWFINLVFWFVVALVFHVALAQQLKKQFNLSGPDGEATLAGYEIWIAVILSLLTTWLVIKWKDR
jgi:hypothetical protein